MLPHTKKSPSFPHSPIFIFTISFIENAEEKILRAATLLLNSFCKTKKNPPRQVCFFPRAILDSLEYSIFNDWRRQLLSHCSGKTVEARTPEGMKGVSLTFNRKFFFFFLRKTDIKLSPFSSSSAKS